jgi:hypothetical protein
MGLGANVLGLRYLVLDANAFRSVAGFNPAEVTREAFVEMRAQERLALIMQNVGRALRGEEGKTVVVLLLNTDSVLAKAIEASPAILEGSELAPVIARGSNVASLIEQACRWLEAGGGEWPTGRSDVRDPRPKKGRPKGSAAKTKDDIYRAAEEARRVGMSWRDFSRKKHPANTLTREEMGLLKARFGTATRA